MNDGQKKFSEYIAERSAHLIGGGRRRTGENYRKFGRSLERFLGERYGTLCLCNITEELVGGYESWLKSQGIALSTVSFYNRIFRSLYNQASHEGIVRDIHPFDHVYTKVVARKRVGMVDLNGEMVSLNTLSRDELVSRYMNVCSRYNTLVSALQRVVKV